MDESVSAVVEASVPSAGLLEQGTGLALTGCQQYRSVSPSASLLEAATRCTWSGFPTGPSGVSPGGMVQNSPNPGTSLGALVTATGALLMKSTVAVFSATWPTVSWTRTVRVRTPAKSPLETTWAG